MLKKYATSIDNRGLGKRKAQLVKAILQPAQPPCQKIWLCSAKPPTLTVLSQKSCTLYSHLTDKFAPLTKCKAAFCLLDFCNSVVVVSIMAIQAGTGGPVDPPEGGFSTAKTVLVVAIVMGCFAVLYPKIFYPMLFETSYNHKPKSGEFSTEV